MITTNQSEPISRRSVLACALISSLLTWLAFPPVGWTALAWVAPCGWLTLVARSRLPSGWRTWWTMWLASSVFWLAYLQGVRLAHPALYLGWFTLSAYLAVYMPVFVALARLAVHRFHWPLTVAAPVTWVALELIRGAFATGFSGGLAGHMLTRWTVFIQVADLGGAYAVSFVVVTTAACIVDVAMRWRSRQSEAGVRHSRRSVAVPVIIGMILLTGDVTYGWWRLRDANAPYVLSTRAAPSMPEAPSMPAAPVRRFRVAVIQESIDAIFEFNEARNRETFERYRRNTLDVLRRHGAVDVIVWPESSYTENSPDILVRDGIPNGELARRVRDFDERTGSLMADIREAGGSGERQPWLIAGTVTVEVSPQGVKEYNSALLIDPTGRVADRYYKQHLVMFGEYIPLGNWFPWFYRLVGMPGGLAEGPRPGLFQVQGTRLSPSICFESMVPHLIRRQVAYGQQAGQPPDLLVNVTNDGWFWGSPILDTHLQSGIFRAIEHRRTFVIAANTGISAVIDRHGRAHTLPRRESGALVAEIQPGGEVTIYQRTGDWPWFGCVVALVGVVLSTIAGRGDRRTGTGGREPRDQTTQTS